MKMKLDNRFHKLEVAMCQVQADIKDIKKMVGKETQDRLEALEEFATYADNMLTELNHALPDPEYDAKCEAAVAGVEASLDRHRERLGLNKPQLKQLDQSIFNGLDEKWRFAVIQNNGFALICTKLPFVAFGGSSWDWNGYSDVVGKGYDTSNWQNSLIERDIAKELLEVDLSSELTGSELCKAMLARGDKCVLIRMGVRDDKQAKDIGRFAIATSIDESGRFNVMSDQQPISKVDFAVPINNQGEPLTAAEVGL